MVEQLKLFETIKSNSLNFPLCDPSSSAARTKFRSIIVRTNKPSRGLSVKSRLSLGDLLLAPETRYLQLKGLRNDFISRMPSNNFALSLSPRSLSILGWFYSLAIIGEKMFCWLHTCSCGFMTFHGGVRTLLQSQNLFLLSGFIERRCWCLPCQ